MTMMKGYVVYPIASYDEKKLFKWPGMNVSKIKEDTMIWVETWYGEDCHVFEIEFREEDILEDMHGSTEYFDGRIVDVVWWRIGSMTSMRKIGKIDWRRRS